MDKIMLPPQYQPFHDLLLCSNRLIDVSIPLLFGSTPVLLIGQGLVPLIWLSAPIDQTEKKWGFILKGGKSANPAVNVLTDIQKREVQVTVSNIEVIRVTAEADHKAVVHQLNLTPIGLEVTGTTDGMKIGGMTFVGNAFSNLLTAFALK